MTPLNVDTTLAGGSARSSASPPPDTHEAVGNWFVRQVANPEDSSHREYAYEIIYCPTDKADYSQCRSAVVWSRGTKGGLGPQSDAPASLVVDAPTRPTRRAAKEQPPTPPVASASEMATAPPPPPPTPTIVAPSGAVSVLVNGTDFESLRPDVLTRVRSWTGRSVDVLTKTGRSVTGVLRNARAEGVTVERDGGKNATLDWSTIESIGLSRAAYTPATP